MAQTQTEETRRPSMTHFTSQCACQNSANKDRSEEVSGSADCATSAGFIACVPQVSLRPVHCDHVRTRTGRPHTQSKTGTVLCCTPKAVSAKSRCDPQAAPNFTRAL